MISSQDKIGQAKARLMMDHPYFGTIASSLEIEKSDTIEAFVSDGKTLQLNNDYFDDAQVEDLEFALANGAMHTVLKHENRAGDRNAWIWQLATDYTINAMLVNNGLMLPQRANFQERFEGMYAEEVYEILCGEINDQAPSDTLNDSEQKAEDESGESDPKSHQDSGSTSQASQAESSSSTQSEERKEEERSDRGKEDKSPEMDLDEENTELFFEQLFNKINRQGTLPKDLEFLVPRYFSHQIDWREMLYRHIASYAKSTFAFVPPNMKYLYRGIYLPSLSSDLLRIVIAIDTSGSVDEDLLSLFLGEVMSITQQYPNFEIDLITADAKIQSHEVFLPGETLTYEIQGRGGTDFRPVFEYIDRYIDHPTLLIYFTDGFGTFPDEEPNYDLLWVLSEIQDVPFGEVMEIKRK